MKVTYNKGIPGSGKSFWSEEYIKNHPGTNRVNKDSIREQMGITSANWSSDKERMIVQTERKTARIILEMGHDLIVDNTGFNKSHENFYRDLAREFHAEFEVKFFDTPLDICIERDSKREKPVGEGVIRKMYAQYIDKDAVKKFAEKREYPIPPRNEELPKAVIVDLDGTLALLNGRNPYERNVYEDDVNWDVVDLVYALYDRGYKVIFMSGRKMNKYNDTKDWLLNKAFDKFIWSNFEGLFMRQDNDNRPDEIVKTELYETHVKGKYDVRFCIDDRPKICKNWRKLGLICLQLNHVEF